MKKSLFEHNEENAKALEEIFADGIRRQIENRDIAAILLYLQVVVLDRCTLDDAIARFAIDVKQVCGDQGIEQWYIGEEYRLIPRRTMLEVTAEQRIAFAEKAVSVIQKVAEKVFR